MGTQIKKILYTTDLSSTSSGGLRYAVNSAKKHGARLVALHVVDYLPPKTVILFEPYPTKEKMDQIAAEDAYTKKSIFKQIDLLWAREMKNAPGSEDILDAFMAIPGNPVDEILKQARELACDAIAMGTHKKGLLRSIYFGGTTKKVLRKTKKPVIIIPLAGRKKRPKWRPRLDNLATGLK